MFCLRVRRSLGCLKLKVLVLCGGSGLPHCDIHTKRIQKMFLAVFVDSKIAFSRFQPFPSNFHFLPICPRDFSLLAPASTQAADPLAAAGRARDAAEEAEDAAVQAQREAERSIEARWSFRVKSIGPLYKVRSKRSMSVQFDGGIMDNPRHDPDCHRTAAPARPPVNHPWPFLGSPMAVP